MYLVPVRLKKAAWLLYPTRSMLPQSGVLNVPPLIAAHNKPGTEGAVSKLSLNREIRVKVTTLTLVNRT
jgi:hypothetical protein